MSALVEKIRTMDTRRLLRITNVRILSQIFFFAVFFVSVWLTWTSRLEGFRVFERIGDDLGPYFDRQLDRLAGQFLSMLLDVGFKSLGIFDRLGGMGLPLRHPRMSMVLRFTAGVQEAGRHVVEIMLKDPDGEELVRVDGEMHLAPGPHTAGGGVRVPHILNMDGLVFPASGR